MRLIEAQTLELHEFFENKVPPYAILSHTWGSEEVSFQEMQAGVDEAKEGFKKIKGCCEQAIEDDLFYVWVDTCCIDKSSSAELSEAINSMFRWYQNAEVCYAYLSDINVKEYISVMLDDFKDGVSAVELPLRESRWFSRGWTLQELLAPRLVEFFDCRWQLFGSKASLCERISQITGIEAPALQGQALASFSVAKRMSWAAKRKTTRTEDIAYCLLGIFGVNMPLLYGEGMQAFTRLQEEIMKDSDDQSLFAWQPLFDDEAAKLGLNPLRGPLAESPQEFAFSGNVVPLRDWALSEPYTMTNKGLRITIPLFSTGSQYLGVLGCGYQGPEKSPLGIVLVKTTEGGESDNQFARVALEKLRKVTLHRLNELQPTDAQTVFMRKVPMDFGTAGKRGTAFWIKSQPQNFTLVAIWPESLWSDSYHIKEIPSMVWISDANESETQGRGAVLVFRDDTNQNHDFVVVLGVAPKLSNAADKVRRHWHHIEAQRPDLDLCKLWKEHYSASIAGAAEEKQYFYSDGSDGCLPVLVRFNEKDVLNATIYETEIITSKVFKITSRTGRGRQRLLTESIEERVSSFLQKSAARIKIRKSSNDNQTETSCEGD